MSRYVQLIDRKCSICGAQMEMVQIKNPFVDDFAEQCTNPKCAEHGRGERRINAAARWIARREE